MKISVFYLLVTLPFFALFDSIIGLLCISLSIAGLLLMSYLAILLKEINTIRTSSSDDRRGINYRAAPIRAARVLYAWLFDPSCHIISVLGSSLSIRGLIESRIQALKSESWLTLAAVAAIMLFLCRQFLFLTPFPYPTAWLNDRLYPR